MDKDKTFEHKLVVQKSSDQVELVRVAEDADIVSLSTAFPSLSRAVQIAYIERIASIGAKNSKKNINTSHVFDDLVK